MKRISSPDIDADVLGLEGDAVTVILNRYWVDQEIQSSQPAGNRAAVVSTPRNRHAELNGLLWPRCCI